MTYVFGILISSLLTLVLISVIYFASFILLASLGHMLWVSEYFIWLAAYVGANLFQSAFSGFCPATMVIAKLGIKTQVQLAQTALKE